MYHMYIYMYICVYIYMYIYDYIFIYIFRKVNSLLPASTFASVCTCLPRGLDTVEKTLLSSSFLSRFKPTGFSQLLCCRVNSAHATQSRPDYCLGFQVQALCARLTRYHMQS